MGSSRIQGYGLGRKLSDQELLFVDISGRHDGCVQRLAKWKHGALPPLEQKKGLRLENEGSGTSTTAAN